MYSSRPAGDIVVRVKPQDNHSLVDPFLLDCIIFSPASFSISMASKNAFADFRFAWFSAKNIPTVVAAMIRGS